MKDKIIASFNMWSFRLARSMSRISTKIYWLVLVIIVFIGLAAIVKGAFGEIVSNMVSPLGMSRYLQGESTSSGWLIVAAYILGLFFFTGIFISLITNYLREAGKRYTFGTLKRYHWNKHVLFLGFDEQMTGTLREACKHNTQIVVTVPHDVPNTRDLLLSLIGRTLMKKVELVQCNPTDLSDLVSRAGIVTASKIFVIGTPDDPVHSTNNLKTMVIIADRLKGMPDNRVPHIMVYLRNQSIFAMLRRQGFNAENLWKMLDKKASVSEQAFLDKHCEYFNFHYNMALHMLSSANGIRPCWPSDNKNLSTNPDSQVHLVVIGMTNVGRPLVREAIKLAHPSGANTRFLVTMVDSDAYEQMHYFTGRTRELFKRCRYSFIDYDQPSRNFEHLPDTDLVDVEFEFIQCNVAHLMLIESLTRWANDPSQMLTLVVCTDESTKNMAMATYLPAELLSGDNAFPIFIFQNGDSSMKMMLDSNIYGDLHPFSLSSHTVEDTATSEAYSTAREIATFYNKNYGEDDAVKWEETPSPSRWSSIYNVLSMEIKMQAIGIKSLSDNIALDDEQQKQRIDIIEHNRWMVEKLYDGFIPTDKEQHEAVSQELEKLKQQFPNWKTDSKARKELDSSRTIFNNLKNGTTVKGVRIHDDLRPFDELDEYTRLKDRILLDNFISTINKKKDE